MFAAASVGGWSGATAVAKPTGSTPATGAGTVSAPTVTGPVTGGTGKPSLVSTSFDLASVGYTSQEYFLSGTASAYSSAKPLTADGKWTVQPASSAPYTTRVVVYRPLSAKKFNGTVVVEWLNVTAGFDTGPVWLSGHNELIRAGAAWVGVSAQAVGVQGRVNAVAGVQAGGLKAADPQRYAPLSHPGDSYSYDIFSQTGIAARGATKPDPLGGLPVKRVIGAGESQSAFRMVTYIDAVQPLAHVYDGFLVYSRSGGGERLSQSPRPAITAPVPTLIRSDLNVPVLTLETESDLFNRAIAFLPARQPDTKRLRLWEVAGTAHADAYTTGLSFTDTGDGQAQLKLLDPAAVTGGPLNCSQPINAGPAYAVVGAAEAHLDRWIRAGTSPPAAPRLTVVTNPVPGISRDSHGNAIGGIRTPLVDAPIAALTGNPNSGGSFCSLFGSTTPFDATTLAALYSTHPDYVAKFGRATDRAVQAGFLLPPDAKNLKAAAAQIHLSNGG